MRTYTIKTTASVGFIYKVTAKNEKEARLKFLDGAYDSHAYDDNWTGDSGEEIDEIEEVKS